MATKRASFTSRIGFVLAAAGSAVGLGNLWRFPYLAAKYGGGIFLLVYILLVVTFGFTLMVAEIGLGRNTRQSVIGAYKSLDKRWSFLGVLSALVPIIIVAYYCVIGGWVTKYFVQYISGMGGAATSDTFFANFTSSTVAPLIFFAIYAGATFTVVLLGVQKGIERVSRVLMPILIVLLIIITIYSLTLPGASEGVKYYFTPDFSKFSPQTVLAALGQMFYSMSLAMGIMVTYGSYMRKEEDLEKATYQISLLDTGIAIMSGLLIVPAVFVFMDGDTSAMGAGPGLMFVTMPKVFGTMGFAGNIIGTMFFILVLFAALTSSISLLETVVSVFQDRFKLSRTKASFISLALLVVMGVPASLGFGLWDGVSIAGFSILDFMDFLTNSVMMPVVALLTCIFIGYVVTPKLISDEVKLSSKFRMERMFEVIMKYIAPILIIGILISAVLDGTGVLTI